MAEQPIRLLLQNPILAPYRIQVVEALNRLPNLDLTLTYGKAQEGSALQSIMDPPGIKVRPLTNTWIGNPHKLNIQLDLLNVLKTGTYDAVILGMDPRHPVNFLAANWAQKNGIAVIWWGHGIRPGGRFENLYKKMALQGDSVILYTEPAKEQFAQLGVPPEKMFVAWNSIDTTTIAKLSKPFTADRNAFLYVGRLIPEKKPQLLVQGFAKAVKEKGLNATLIVLGEGPEREPVARLANELGVGDQTEVLGATYDETVLAEYFNRAYVSVSPGYVGLSAIHCLAYGVPMLAADDEPHSPEIVAVHDQENSLFFKADNAEDLANQLVYMRQNPDKMTGFSNNAKDYIADNFSAEQMAQHMYDAVDYAVRQLQQS